MGAPKAAAPAGPFDRNSVPAENQHIVDAITRYFPVLEEVERNAARRAELQEKIEIAFRQLASRSVKPGTVQLLDTLAEQLNRDSLDEALKTHAAISRSDWDSNKEWLVPLKRLLLRK
eukprot:TRINITY_DN1169_c0_g1_i2.p2 TRINITY_DN1169_c0_g1~~TRINITY_DN1169_c0_g1_i2.p2  ORF type:complete len:118 (-),score=36.83 TRINITY_DN1169_c0_g1_i2:164-517(-)